MADMSELRERAERAYKWAVAENDHIEPELVRTLLDELDRVEAKLAQSQSDFREQTDACGKWIARCKAAESALDRVEKERDEARTILAELVDRDLSYQGENIVIPTAGHGNGIALVNRARRILARSRRPQNREETDAENERIS